MIVVSENSQNDKIVAWYFDWEVQMKVERTKKEGMEVYIATVDWLEERRTETSGRLSKEAAVSWAVDLINSTKSKSRKELVI